MSSAVINTKTLDNFIRWAKENGSLIDDRLSFKISNKTGIHVVLNSKIDVDKEKEVSPLISTPKELLITRKSAESHFNITKDVNSELNKYISNPNVITQLYLCKLKFSNNDDHSNQFFKPYLDLLSLNLEQPYFWSNDELSFLKGTDLLIILYSNLNKLYEEWNQLLNILNIEHKDKSKNVNDNSEQIIEYIQNNLDALHKGNVEWTSFIAYVWSNCIFTSRAFPELIISDHQKVTNLQQAFLYPVVDLLNHRNDENVEWTYSDGKVNFFSKELQTLNVGDELYNNYGDKSNEELLLGYGFVEENNNHENSRLTLRLDPTIIQSALDFGIKLTNVMKDNSCVQFIISYKDPIPRELVIFFGYLEKLKSEKVLVYRSILEGVSELSKILQSKLDFFKSHSKVNGQFPHGSIIKQYMISQKKIYIKSIETLQKFQKSTIKSIPSKEVLSFKTIFKNDQLFANSLLFAFGITSFEDLVKRDYMKQALLLWIVRASNLKKDSNKKLPFSVPKYIYDTFEEVSKNIVIEKNDVMEYMNFYKELFPKLTVRIPEVYEQGNWGIRQFIVADTVIDNLVWINQNNQEPLILNKVRFE